MAKIQSPFPISGSVGDYTFATNGDTSYMKMKNWLQDKRWHKDRAFKRARENAQTFGGAAKVACRIYSTLAGNRTNRKEGKSRKIYLPYSHNQITRRIHKHAEKQGRAATHYGFAAAFPALQGLDLSNKASQTHHITLQPIGPNHCPTHLNVGGLQEAAKTIQGTLNGNSRLELRLQLIHIAFPEVTYDKEDKEWNFTNPGSHLIRRSPKSAWIPAEFLAKEALRLSLMSHFKQSKGSPTPACHVDPSQKNPCHFDRSQLRKQSRTPLKTDTEQRRSTRGEELESQGRKSRQQTVVADGFAKQYAVPELCAPDTPSVDHPNTPTNTKNNSELCSPNSELAQLIFLEIEWQEVRNTGTIKPLNTQAIVRLAAMHYDEATAQAIAALKPKKPHPKPKPQFPTTLSPEQFLQKALQGLIERGPPKNRKPG